MFDRALIRWTGSALLALTLAACASAPAPAPLTETLARAPQLSTFNRLVAEAGLSEELRAAGPLTVFAPSDEAFEAVPAKTMEALLADKAQLKAVLSYHIVAGKLPAAEVRNSNQKTLQGASLALARAGDFVTVEEAMVQQADISATNGVAHVVDRVLMPPKK
ncbi:fasciclin domain-containing protein [Pelomonas sp. SE-A7]|uniref:fasciclin domain-containing protein n=1 Tax=Pelomonas sp. SE-A7 TaxID=3054953 RepID=UPI00259D26CA|nr:fasciclin domain-containing protein [Pelomonas sp. SE-A7]MDM4764829.1 fasciclin domain-containing protein [Pelomonas sp. SE-A7]